MRVIDDAFNIIQANQATPKLLNCLNEFQLSRKRHRVGNKFLVVVVYVDLLLSEQIVLICFDTLTGLVIGLLCW